MSSTPNLGPLPPDISRGSDLLIVNWLTIAIALLLVSLRVYIRRIRGKRLGWDDYTILLASVFAIAQNIFSTLQVQSGFGRNIYYLTPVQIRYFGLYTFIYILLQIVGIGLVRISVCLFVLRLMPDFKVYYRRWILGLVAFNTIVSLADIFFMCFQCIPLAGSWDKSVKTRCVAQADFQKIAQVQGSVSAITDLFCVLLPMLVFRGLQVSLRNKVAIFVILGLGLFTAAAATARTVTVDLISKNPTWDLFPVGIWACLEQHIGIIVACLPALRQLFTVRKQPHSGNSSQTLCNHRNNNTRPPLHSFAQLSDSDRILLPDDGSSDGTSSRKGLPMPMSEMSDIERCHNTRPSPSVVSPPLWTERKISSAESVEMSRVSPTTTVVGRKPSSTETVRLSLTTPSWHHGKASPTDKVHPRNKRNLSIISPLSVDTSPPPFSAGRVQQLGKFEETGLRHSKVAAPDEMKSFGNAASVGYSCKIQGGTPKGTTPKISPKISPEPSPKPPLW